MKKLLLMALAMTCLWTTTHAQVGINTTNPTPGTILDINADDKGILIPRVDIDNPSSGTQIEGGPLPNGLLVYNTNQTTGEGFYYWYNTQWIPIGSEFSWRLTGNSGVNPETNFIGTVTNDPLVFKTNDVERMRILSSNGYVGLGVENPTQKLHIAGNLRLDGAFMPNNQPGNEGQILISQGVANNPTWGPNLHNVSEMALYVVGPIEFPENSATALTVTVNGAGIGSTAIVTIRGLNNYYDYIEVNNIQVGTDSVRFTLTNYRSTATTLSFNITIIQ